MTTTTTNHTEIEELVRQTAERLEAEGAFVEGTLDITGDIPSTLEPYVEKIRRHPCTQSEQVSQFMLDEADRFLDSYEDDLRFRLYPRKEPHSNSPLGYVFIVQEPDSPVRVKFRLSGPAEVLSIEDDRARRPGISIHPGAHPILLLLRLNFKSEEIIENWYAYELRDRGILR